MYKALSTIMTSSIPRQREQRNFLVLIFFTVFSNLVSDFLVAKQEINVDLEVIGRTFMLSILKKQNMLQRRQLFH
jgi:hypothetical protein